MDAAELSAVHPRLFHMTTPSGVEGIRRHGLLSTTALLDKFEVAAAYRATIEDSRRPECVEIEHPVHGRATIRDNKPLREEALRSCLQDGMTPPEWYRLLNRKVFFWPSSERVADLRGARAYRKQHQVVLIFDTRSLLEAYGEAVTLSPINSGATLYRPQPRGPSTFRTVADYPFTDLARRRGRRKAIAEFAVDYAVLDAMEHVLDVKEYGPMEDDA